MNKIKVLILGKNGMVGNIVFKYLKSINQTDVFAVDRKLFSVETFEKDFKSIKNKTGKINYVINCIGLKGPKNTQKQFNDINGTFTQKLAKALIKEHIKLIHISTDAVFNPKQGISKESDRPNPIEAYGISKLKGEVNLTNTLIIRTSLVGFSKKPDGLFEWVKRSKTDLEGYVNQSWSGCTSLQFAKLCSYIIFEDKFEELRSKSPIFHFAPLGPITKYLLIKEIVKLTNPKIKVKKAKSSNGITRFLSSKYFDKKFLKPYTTNLKEALAELIKFETYEKI